MSRPHAKRCMVPPIKKTYIYHDIMIISYLSYEFYILNVSYDNDGFDDACQIIYF